MNPPSKNPSKFLLAALLPIVLTLPAKAETLRASGEIIGSIFNTSSRQHIQASFSGSGQVLPSGDRGRANGRVTSVIGNRPHRASLAGPYRVLVQGHVFHDGGSFSFSRTVTVTVYRTMIVIPSLGRVQLNKPLNLTQAGRQTFRAHVNFSVPVP